MELIGLFTDIAILWNEREFVRFRNAVSRGWIIPLIFLIPGTFLGFLGFGTKLLIMEIGIIIASFHAVRFFVRRALFVGEIATAVTRLQLRGKISTIGAAEAVAKQYVTFAAAVCASEAAIGFIAILAPAHRNPLAGVLALLAGWGVLTYCIWKYTGVWWAKVVAYVNVGTLILAFAMMVFPQGTRCFIEGTLWGDTSACKEEGRDREGGRTSSTGAAALSPPICAGEREHKLNVDESVSVPLRQDCTTGWINFPPNAYFKIRNPGKLEMILWSGERYALGSDDVTYLNPSKVKVSVFRLRGDGVADVYIEKKT